MSSEDLGAVVSGKEEESDGPEFELAFGSEFIIVFEVIFDSAFGNFNRAINNR